MKRLLFLTAAVTAISFFTSAQTKTSLRQRSIRPLFNATCVKKELKHI